MSSSRVVSCIVVIAAHAACTTAATDGAPAPPGSWANGPALPVARFEAYAAALDGRVYFIGGITGELGDIATAQPSRRVDVLDPVTRTWTSAPELPADAPKHHLTVAVTSDRVLVLGGFDGILGQRQNEPFRPIAVAYAFDGVTWKRLAAPPLARGAATAQVIGGKVYVTGGAPTEGQAPYAQLDVYDIASDHWSTGAPMPTAREHVASCALDGRMIVLGGWVSVGGADVAQTAAESYDPELDRWSVLPPMGTARGGLSAIAQGSTCHVVGGEDWALPLPGTFGTHEVFDARSGTWALAAPMPTARHGFGLAWLGDRLFAVGGGPSQGNSYSVVVEVFTP